VKRLLLVAMTLGILTAIMLSATQAAVPSRSFYVYPNPAAYPTQPTIKAVGLGLSGPAQLTIYDRAGRAVLRTALDADGEGNLAYTWTSNKASGAYYAVLRGTASGGGIVEQARFAVIR